MYVYTFDCIYLLWYNNMLICRWEHLSLQGHIQPPGSSTDPSWAQTAVCMYQPGMCWARWPSPVLGLNTMGFHCGAPFTYPQHGWSSPCPTSGKPPGLQSSWTQSCGHRTWLSALESLGSSSRSLDQMNGLAACIQVQKLEASFTIHSWEMPLTTFAHFHSHCCTFSKTSSY